MFKVKSFKFFFKGPQQQSRCADLFYFAAVWFVHLLDIFEDISPSD